MTVAEQKRATPPASNSALAIDEHGELEAPHFDGPLSESELNALLNLLIESTRAGAKVAAVFACRISCQDRRGMYLDIQGGASKIIQSLSRILKARGVEPSDATNGFFDRAMDLPEKADRVAFFVRGQNWLLATLIEAIPHIDDAEIAAVFRDCATQIEQNRDRAQTYKVDR